MAEFVEEIVSGRLRPGDALPTEVAVAERFGISRGVARECVRGLEERGLVSVRHGSATTVNTPERWDVLDEFVIGSTVGGPSAAERIDSYLDTRRVAELHATGLAAEQATEDQLATLEDHASALRDAAAMRSRRERDRSVIEAYVAYHSTLVIAGANAPIASLVNRIVGALATAGYPFGSPSYWRSRGASDHDTLNEALRQGDSNAARIAITAHLDEVEDGLRAHARRIARSA
ncbi:FadR/GntR family transcriptional regulator [Solirubrobacter pauli]|nr:FCD domain-containing protein [Solirubrobacter pauli]